MFLDKPQQYGKQDDDGDDDGLEGMPEESGDDRGAEQNEDQRILELREERPPGRLRRQRLQLIGAMDGESMRGLGARQSRQGRAQLLERRVDRERMPRGRQWRALLDAVLRGHTDPPGPCSSPNRSTIVIVQLH